MVRHANAHLVQTEEVGIRMLLCRGLHLGHASEKFFYLLVAHGIVGQVAIDITVVGWHIDESMPRQIEKNDWRLAFNFGFLGFADGGGDGMAALRSWDDTFTLGKD